MRTRQSLPPNQVVSIDRDPSPAIAYGWISGPRTLGCVLRFRVRFVEPFLPPRPSTTREIFRRILVEAPGQRGMFGKFSDECPLIGYVREYL